MFNLGKITSGLGFVGETIADTAGGIYGGAKEAFSDRMPTAKAIGGPLTGISPGAISPGIFMGPGHMTLGLIQSQRFKETAARTIVGGLDPVFGEDAPLDISEPAKAGDYAGALDQLGKTVTKPIVETGQALTLPLLAVAGILLLK